MSSGHLYLRCPGQISSAGTGVAALVSALADRQWRAEAGLDRPDAPPLSVVTCREFTPQGHLPPMVARRLDRPARLLAVAARECLSAAGTEPPRSPQRTGVAAATGNAGTEALFQVLKAVFLQGPEESPPMQFPSTVANAPASQIAILEKLSGPNITFAEKQVGGLRAVIEAARLVRHGRADTVLAAAVDEAQWLNAEGYDRLGATATPDRVGFTLGEGAGVLLVDHSAGPAAARLAGWGAAAMPTPTYLYPRRSDALATAVETALQRSGQGAGAIDLVISMANGSPMPARLEHETLTRVLGEHRPAALAVTDRLGEGSFSSLLRVLVAVLVITGRAEPAWDPPRHLAEAGFSGLGCRPRSVLVTGVAGGGSSLAVVLSAE